MEEVTLDATRQVEGRGARASLQLRAHQRALEVALQHQQALKEELQRLEEAQQVRAVALQQQRNGAVALQQQRGEAVARHQQTAVLQHQQDNVALQQQQQQQALKEELEWIERQQEAQCLIEAGLPPLSPPELEGDQVGATPAQEGLEKGYILGGEAAGALHAEEVGEGGGNDGLVCPSPLFLGFNI